MNPETLPELITVIPELAPDADPGKADDAAAILSPV